MLHCRHERCTVNTIVRQYITLTFLFCWLYSRGYGKSLMSLLQKTLVNSYNRSDQRKEKISFTDSYSLWFRTGCNWNRCSGFRSCNYGRSHLEEMSVAILKKMATVKNTVKTVIVVLHWCNTTVILRAYGCILRTLLSLISSTIVKQLFLEKCWCALSGIWLLNRHPF